MTDSMRKVIAETERRRTIQREYNEQHGLRRARSSSPSRTCCIRLPWPTPRLHEIVKEARKDFLTVNAMEDLIERLEQEMRMLAKKQEFEKAAELRMKSSG